MNNLLKFWDSIGTPKILVIGDIIVDRYTWGDADRVSPEAPVIVLKVNKHEARLGGAASVASLLRSLEVAVSIAGVVGDDANGSSARRLLDEAGVDCCLVHCDDDRPTTAKQRFIGRAEGKHPHQVLRVDEECTDLLSTAIQQRIVDQSLDGMDDFDAVIISDYAKGVCRSMNESKPDDRGETMIVPAVIRAANERGIPVLVDPARIAGLECYRGATILKANRVEAELSAGFRILNPGMAMRAGEMFCETQGLHAAVITLDREGMVLSRPGVTSEQFRAAPRTVCDITGAGDMAIAMLAMAMGCRQADSFETQFDAIPNAVRLANIAAGLEVERFGVTAVTRHEIKDEIVKLIERGQID